MILVQQRLPSLLDRPIMFAHRGARAHAPENTLEAFALGLRLGATGLESDVWLTATACRCSTTTESSAGRAGAAAVDRRVPTRRAPGTSLR